MNISMSKLFVIIALTVGLLSGGCANYLQPEVGVIALEESTIMLEKLNADPYTWKTEDVSLRFATTKNGNSIELSGVALFSNRLVNTFNRAKSFNLKVSLLDGQRQVIGVSDITPMFAMGAEVPEKVPFKAIIQLLPGSKAITFNFYGVFAGDTPSMGTSEIFHFPFE